MNFYYQKQFHNNYQINEHIYLKNYQEKVLPTDPNNK